MFGLEWYLIPIIGYLVFYMVLYLGPLLHRIATSRLGDDTETLTKRINTEVQKAKERRTADYRGQAAAAPSGDGAGGHGEEATTGTGDDPVVIEHVEEGGTRRVSSPESAEEPSDATEEAEPPDEGHVAERPFLSRTLESSFGSTLVQEAIRQLRTKYPHGNFRHFELERLPAYASYNERLTAARNMAGLFVLFGLLGTMIKLNQIVQQIGDAAGTGEMQAEMFLNNMGLIMSNIGGAFDSSIYGLTLMVIALVVIGGFDRIMQYRLDALDTALQNEVVPGLSELQLMQAPDLSIGDLITRTSTLLDDLNGSVETMTEGMNASLDALGGEINKMMQDFGSFQNQYAQLNDLITHLKDYTSNVQDVTSAIEGAGHTLANPISTMNRDLNNAIREQMGMLGEAIASSEADRNALIESFKSVENDLKRQTQRISDIARDSLGEIGEQQDRNVEILEHEIEMLAEQSDVVRSELRAVTEALENANSQELAAVIATLQERMDEGSGSLSTSAGQLSDSAVEISKSADRLRRVSRGLKVSKTSPHSAFEWLYRTVQDARNGST